MTKENFVDLVVSGPDMSGTSTQICQIIDYFKKKGLVVKDFRGGEIDALFHAKVFEDINRDFMSLDAWMKNTYTTKTDVSAFLHEADMHLHNLKVASFLDNEVSSFVDPSGYDVVVMEEPPKRGAGLDIRTFELNRSRYGSSHHPIAEALLFQAYRSTEFFRFRKIARELGLIVLRSRSEESACYQGYDKAHLPNGMKLPDYFALPGHEVAFGNAPTDLIIAQAGPEWSQEEYIKLKKDRAGNRVLDDHELMVDYQLLVNQRYATNWLEDLYEKGCALHKGTVPHIHRVDMYDNSWRDNDGLRRPRTAKEIKTDLYTTLEEIMLRAGDAGSID